MAGHFKIAADTAFTTSVTTLDQDPTHGEYDPAYEWEARGSHLRTLGGMVHQDFGVNEADRVIMLRDEDALTQATYEALKTKYEAVDTDWYFTDGVQTFKVRFSRSPRGFRAWRNMRLWGLGLQLSQPPPSSYIWYSYEIILRVIEEVTE
jgi:hypothetical protein